MNGKLVGGGVVLAGLLAGAAIYYLQIYGFYQEVEAKGLMDVQIVTAAERMPEPIPHSEFRAVDADSSPIRYRACFTTTLDLEAARARYVIAPDAEPRNAPDWFDCFDAAAIGAALKAGTATAFLSHKNIAYGVDRVVALTADGRGYSWHVFNNCGDKDYDGTVTGEECPPPPTPDT